jgi:hypothetical protein
MIKKDLGSWKQWLVAVCARACSPIDFVLVAGFVMVHDNLISEFNLYCKVFLVKI